MEKEARRCRRCGSERNAKWGKRKGAQCYRCKDCGFQFTAEHGRRSQEDERTAITLYCLGFSFRTIGLMLNYHRTTVLKWINGFAKARDAKPVPKSEILLEPDEARRFIQSQNPDELGKHAAGQIYNFLNGNAKITIPPLLAGRITE
ncbi:MAG: hypothetical protein LBL66_09770 [Clostridiales bacterium]|jgi:transposase|nr:hypothetical protein [Clostridiales bacterium]